jgi:hypothetical protein
MIQDHCIALGTVAGAYPEFVSAMYCRTSSSRISSGTAEKQVDTDWLT